MSKRGSITNYAAQEFLGSNEFDLSKASILAEGASLVVEGPARLAMQSGQRTRTIWIMSSATLAGPLLHTTPEPADREQVLAATARVVRRNLELVLMVILMAGALGWMVLSMLLDRPGPGFLLMDWGMAISRLNGAPIDNPFVAMLIGAGIPALGLMVLGGIALPRLARRMALALTEEGTKA